MDVDVDAMRTWTRTVAGCQANDIPLTDELSVKTVVARTLMVRHRHRDRESGTAFETHYPVEISGISAIAFYRLAGTGLPCA